MSSPNGRTRERHYDAIVIGSNVVDTLAEYAPNLSGSMEQMQVLGPPDIERTIGITGTNIFLGEILLDQMFGNCPVAGYPSHRSPVDGLYLSGSGAWPGGAVFGGPGPQLRPPGARGHGPRPRVAAGV